MSVEDEVKEVEKKTVTYKMCTEVEEQGKRKMVCSGTLTARYNEETKAPLEVEIKYPTEEEVDIIRETASQKVTVTHDPKTKVETYVVTEEKTQTETETPEQKHTTGDIAIP